MFHTPYEKDTFQRVGEWANVNVRLNGVINKIARFDWPVK